MKQSNTNKVRKQRFELPVGQQEISIPEELRDQLSAILTGETKLVGSRVWIEQRGDDLFLHVGDLSVGEID